MPQTAKATQESTRRMQAGNVVAELVRRQYPGVKIAHVTSTGDVVLASPMTAKLRRQLSGNIGYELFEESGQPPRLQVIGVPASLPTPLAPINNKERR